MLGSIPLHVAQVNACRRTLLHVNARGEYLSVAVGDNTDGTGHLAASCFFARMLSPHSVILNAASITSHNVTRAVTTNNHQITR